MRIDQYRFGHITIAGHSYGADVIIFPDHVQKNWWRREGHRLATDDIQAILAAKPELLVVGTGYFGRMQVAPETLDYLRAEGVDVRVARTGEAVDEFNRLQQECAAIVAAMHLTC